jgi:hypothetical protein
MLMKNSSIIQFQQVTRAAVKPQVKVLHPSHEQPTTN